MFDEREILEKYETAKSVYDEYEKHTNGHARNGSLSFPYWLRKKVKEAREAYQYEVDHAAG